MRKSVTKIVKATVAAAMMIGAGVGAAFSGSKSATSVVALGSRDCWAQVTSLSGLNTTDKYVIASDQADGDGTDYYFKGTTSSGHLQSSTFSDNAPANNSAAGVFQLISVNAESNIYKIKLVSSSKAVTATKAGSGGGSVTSSVDDAEGWKFLLDGDKFNAIYQHEYSSKYAALRCYSFTSWRTYSNNSATSISTTSGTSFRIYKYRQFDSISVSTAPTKLAYNAGETFDPTGLVITRNYSDGSSSTFSYADHTTEFSFSPSLSTGLAVENTAVSITYGGKTTSQNITVSAVLTPYITVSKNATSGYTTENETLSFSFGNLNNAPTVVSSDTSVVTIEEPSISDGAGTVQINFVGAGTTSVLFKDGETQMASVSVSVTIEHGRIKTDPLSVEEALDIGDALEESEETTKDYYINGFVSPTIKNPTFSGTPAKTTFWLAKDESTSKGFECYKVTLADGLDSEDLKVGADVIVHCTIKKYNSTTIENGSVGEIVGLSFSSVPATSIEINKNSASLVVGGETSLNVKTLLPVYTTDVAVWSSSEENVATVDQTGTVIAVGTGTAIISATAGSISAECIVNVSDEIIDLSNKSYEYHKPASIENAVHTLTIGGYSMNLLNVYNQTTNTAQPPVTTTYNYLAFGSKDFTTANTLLSNKTPVPGAITKIVFHSRSGSSQNAVYKAIVSSTEVTSPVAGEVDSLTGIGTLTINVDASLNRRYFAISCVTTGYNGQLDSIEITYETTAETIENYSTRAMLSYGYSKLAENSYEFDDVAIRFGGLVSVEMWNRLNSESTIIGYGVMLSTTVHVNSNGGQLKALSINGSTVVVFEKSVPGDKEHPVLASAEQKGNLIGDYYIWNLYNNVPSGFLTASLTAVTYIKTSSGNVYFKQVTTSVKGLAQDMIASDAYDEDSLDGSLNYLANLA